MDISVLCHDKDYIFHHISLQYRRDLAGNVVIFATGNGLVGHKDDISDQDFCSILIHLITRCQCSIVRFLHVQNNSFAFLRLSDMYKRCDMNTMKFWENLISQKLCCCCCWSKTESLSFFSVNCICNYVAAAGNIHTWWVIVKKSIERNIAEESNRNKQNWNKRALGKIFRLLLRSHRQSLAHLQLSACSLLVFAVVQSNIYLIIQTNMFVTWLASRVVVAVSKMCPTKSESSLLLCVSVCGSVRGARDRVSISPAMLTHHLHWICSLLRYNHSIRKTKNNTDY